MDKILYLNDNFEIQNTVETDNFLAIEGYACHYDKKNLNNQVVDGESFRTFFEMYKANQLNPRLNYNHTDDVIGGIDELTPMSDGIWIKAHLNKMIPMVKDMIIPNVLAGDINSFSTEGYVKGGYNGIVELENGYYVKDFILTGVSVVSTPADAEATFSIANYIREYDEWLKKEQTMTNRKIHLLI